MSVGTHVLGVGIAAALSQVPHNVVTVVARQLNAVVVQEWAKIYLFGSSQLSSMCSRIPGCLRRDFAKGAVTVPLDIHCRKELPLNSDSPAMSCGAAGRAGEECERRATGKDEQSTGTSVMDDEPVSNDVPEECDDRCVNTGEQTEVRLSLLSSKAAPSVSLGFRLPAS